MLHTRGAYALMVDADGATDINDLEKLFTRTQAAEAPCPSLGDTTVVAVGIGSRAHYEKDSVAQRAWYRTVLMKGLHVLVSLCISARIRDTQCGAFWVGVWVGWGGGVAGPMCIHSFIHSFTRQWTDSTHTHTHTHHPSIHPRMPQASSSSPAGPSRCSSAPSTWSGGASTSRSSTSATAWGCPWW